MALDRERSARDVSRFLLMHEFDYVVIGGGSAGCALAARLSEDPSVGVCLVEAGGSGRSMLIDTPILFAVTVPRAIHD
jgi:choline dehydrogenase-like flavoprotein